MLHIDSMEALMNVLSDDEVADSNTPWSGESTSYHSSSGKLHMWEVARP